MVVLGTSPDRRRAEYAIYAALLCLGYVLFYGWLLARSDGLPYVMDNNESFSSLWHATNLYHFGLERSFGLTDEAYGFAPEAHTYVYTHQGNFPRIFALVIYAAGARTVEAQIIVTTFTVGLAAVLFAFAFLARMTGSRPFAALACVLMFTDYVLVAQWQVVTYRVWHAFFVFSTFLCVDWFERGRNPRAFALLVLNGACLFYFELLFAACVTAAAGFYVLFRNWRKPGVAVLAGTALGIGLVIGVVTLCAQIVLYMGWDNFVKDATYTFSARNQFADAGTMERTLRSFMESNHIVFWYNLFDASGFRNPFHLVASLTYTTNSRCIRRCYPCCGRGVASLAAALVMAPKRVVGQETQSRRSGQPGLGCHSTRDRILRLHSRRAPAGAAQPVRHGVGAARGLLLSGLDRMDGSGNRDCRGGAGLPFSYFGISDRRADGFG